MPELSLLLQYNHSKGVHLTRFVNRNDAAFGSPWSSGLGAGGQNGIGTLWSVESSAKSLYDGVTIGLAKKWSHNFQFQTNYTMSWDKSDDDNERDPFTLRYAKVTDRRYGHRTDQRLGPTAGCSEDAWRLVNVRYCIARQPHAEAGRNLSQTPFVARPIASARWKRGQAQHRTQGQRAPSLDLRISRELASGRSSRADLEVFQPAQQREPQAARSYQPDLQPRRTVQSEWRPAPDVSGHQAALVSRTSVPCRGSYPGGWGHSPSPYRSVRDDRERDGVLLSDLHGLGERVLAIQPELHLVGML